LYVEAEKKDLFSHSFREIASVKTKERCSILKHFISPIFLDISAISETSNKILHSILYWIIETLTRRCIAIRNLKFCHKKEKPKIMYEDIKKTLETFFNPNHGKRTISDTEHAHHASWAWACTLQSAHFAQYSDTYSDRCQNNKILS
jgi:hypothetical protein